MKAIRLVIMIVLVCTITLVNVWIAREFFEIKDWNECIYGPHPLAQLLLAPSPPPPTSQSSVITLTPSTNPVVTTIQTFKSMQQHIDDVEMQLGLYTRPRMDYPSDVVQLKFIQEKVFQFAMYFGYSQSVSLETLSSMVISFGVTSTTPNVIDLLNLLGDKIKPPPSNTLSTTSSNTAGDLLARLNQVQPADNMFTLSKQIAEGYLDRLFILIDQVFTKIIDVYSPNPETVKTRRMDLINTSQNLMQQLFKGDAGVNIYQPYIKARIADNYATLLNQLDPISAPQNPTGVGPPVPRRIISIELRARPTIYNIFYEYVYTNQLFSDDTWSDLDIKIPMNIPGATVTLTAWYNDDQNVISAFSTRRPVEDYIRLVRTTQTANTRNFLKAMRDFEINNPGKQITLRVTFGSF